MPQAIESTLLVNLGCRKDERIAIVTDDGPFAQPTPEFPDRAALAEAFRRAAVAAGLNAKVIRYGNLGRSGIEPPLDIFAAVYPPQFVEYAEKRGLLKPLLDKSISSEGIAALTAALGEMQPKFDVMLVLSRFSISHTRFRTLLSNSGLIRAATMPGVEPFMFTGAMTANWPLVKARSEAVARLLSHAERVEIESPGQRKLTFSIAGRAGAADTGLLTEPGAFGNLPGGEAFIAPIEGTANGEVSIGSPTDPAAWGFKFKNGNMVSWLGNPPFSSKIDAVFAEFPLARNLAELGVGTNEKAASAESILEAEKILGTIHLALGDNAGFGGKVSVPYHHDFVVYRPTLRLVDASGATHLVLDNGKFLIETN